MVASEKIPARAIDKHLETLDVRIDCLKRIPEFTELPTFARLAF